MGEEGQKCKGCGDSSESLQHVIRKCQVTGRANERVEVLLEPQVRRNLARLHEIVWKRKGAVRVEGRG